MAKSKKKLPARQGKQDDYGVGHKKPPKDSQFKPGQSGNPKGPPKRRTNLWVWFCKYMSMTDAELDKACKKKLTQAQQVAKAIVDKAKTGEKVGSQRLALAVFDREEGRAVEHIIIGDEDQLSDDDCEEIRAMLQENQGKKKGKKC